MLGLAGAYLFFGAPWNMEKLTHFAPVTNSLTVIELKMNVTIDTNDTINSTVIADTADVPTAANDIIMEETITAETKSIVAAETEPTVKHHKKESGIPNP
jgi:hypothetical protein